MQEEERDQIFYRLLAVPVRKLFLNAGIRSQHLQEIRMRADMPLLFTYEGRECAFTESGTLTGRAEQGWRVTAQMLSETLECMSGYSLYAFDEEMKQGFLTLPGGHRVGLAGKIVLEGGVIQCIRYISFLNIRLSHQIPGCADRILPYLTENGQLCHTLIISPPGCGKTTLLRDIIRQVSNGTGYLPGQTVGVVDERSEIAGSYMGVPQNDLGIRTDVLDCCSRTEGMMMLLRSMSPQVIAVDELGGGADGSAVESVFYCGCRLLATAHGSSIDDIRKRPLLQKMIRVHMFERYVVLHGREQVGTVREIFNGRGSVVYREKE